MSSALAEATASKAVAQQSRPTARDLIQAQQSAIEAQLAGAIDRKSVV